MTDQEKEKILLTAATGFEDLAGSLEKFAVTIKSQAQAIDHKRLFSCGAEILGAADVMRDWASGIREEVTE